jgi:hypothetical protein
MNLDELIILWFCLKALKWLDIIIIVHASGASGG